MSVQEPRDRPALRRQGKTGQRKQLAILPPAELYDDLDAAAVLHRRSKSGIATRALELGLTQAIAELDAAQSLAATPTE